jgi:hypothetical protein
LRSTAALVDSEAEAREVLVAIQNLLDGSVSTSEKIAALEAAQVPLYYLGERGEATRYLSIVRQMEPWASDLEDQARLGTTLATCVWLARKRDQIGDVIRQVRLLCDRCRSSGLGNLSTLNLLIASACLQTSVGMYTDALESFMMAHSIASKLGNEPKMGSAASNISVCQGRIGKYGSQLKWAEKAISQLRGAGVGWKCLQAAYSRSLALCMMGENRKALNSIEEITDGVLGQRPTWSAQGAPLLIADIYYASGDPSRASKTAAAALGGGGAEPLTNGYAGIVARWMARTSIEMGTELAARQAVQRLCVDIESHDLIDQAEIICARLSLEASCGQSWTPGRAMLAERLSRLPGAVEDQLRRLGAVN